MPLIQSKSAAAAASLLSRVQHLAGNYNAAASHLNAIVKDLLALSNADLAAFANQLGPVSLGELTLMHGDHGSAVNRLSALASTVLAESGVTWPASTVDVRGLDEKLAEQGRQMTFADGVFTVSPIPQPAEEPEDGTVTVTPNSETTP